MCEDYKKTLMRELAFGETDNSVQCSLVAWRVEAMGFASVPSSAAP